MKGTQKRQAATFKQKQPVQRSHTQTAGRQTSILSQSLSLSFTSLNQVNASPSHFTRSSPISYDTPSRQFSSSAMKKNMLRSTSSIYRDCLRLIDHMAGKSVKGDRMRELLRGEFRKNADITDQNKIETLRGHAIQGLTNYLTVASLARSNKKFSPVVDGRVEIPLAARASDERKKKMQDNFDHHQKMLNEVMNDDQTTTTTTVDGYDVEMRGVNLNRTFEDLGKNIDQTSVDAIVDAVNREQQGK